MTHLVIPKIDCIESGDNFAKFAIGPVEKGFGVTLGNSLRRVLLRYLTGAAVTGIRVEGIQHELSTIPHVREDVTEFILNVKELRLVPVTGQPSKLILDVEGERTITAADIQPSVDVEIANLELYLATLSSPESKLYVEFDVELGEGYREAEPSDSLPIGVIPVDAVFTPVREVNFAVELTHFGEKTSRERLLLEVCTDGTISPVEAITRSAAALVEQLTPFVNYAQVSQAEVEEERIRLAIPEELFNEPIENLNLSVRTINCLRRGGIENVGQMISKGEEGLMALRNFGEKSKREITEQLAARGLSLNPQLEGSDQPDDEEVTDEA